MRVSACARRKDRSYMEPSMGNESHQKTKQLRTFRPGLRAGILGGGQLAQMLVADAVGLGLHPVIYAENADDPAARMVSNPHVGSLSDAEKLGRFLSVVDLVVFENEFVRCDVLVAVSGA